MAPAWHPGEAHDLWIILWKDIANVSDQIVSGRAKDAGTDILRNSQAKSVDIALGQMPGEHQANSGNIGPTEAQGFHLGVMLATGSL
jgi:hypothetical protein